MVISPKPTVKLEYYQRVTKQQENRSGTADYWLSHSPLTYYICESNTSLYTPVTLDSTSYPPQPLEEDNSPKQQLTKTKHYRTPQSTGKKKSGLTPHTLFKQAKSKYTLYT